MPIEQNRNEVFFGQNFRHIFVCHHQWQENERKKDTEATGGQERCYSAEIGSLSNSNKEILPVSV